MNGWVTTFWILVIAASAYLLARGNTFLRRPRLVLAYGVIGFLALATFATHQLLLGVDATTQQGRGLIGQAVLIYAFSLFFLCGAFAAGIAARRSRGRSDAAQQAVEGTQHPDG